MVSPVAIVLGGIFILIVLIIVVGFLYFNKARPPTALITDFGLTIRTPDNLYMSMENITNPGVTGLIVFPIMVLTNLSGNDPEPPDGWLIERPKTYPSDTNIVTFLNPSNSGYINYTVDAAGNLQDGIIRTDRFTPPPDPINGNTGSFLGWFEMSQDANTRITTFKSLFPGPIRGSDRYLIPGTRGQLPLNPNIIPVTIDIATNNNNQWIVG